jgi:N-acetyl-anhydromuramyl-L-alanine amidase AmpD
MADRVTTSESRQALAAAGCAAVRRRLHVPPGLPGPGVGPRTEPAPEAVYRLPTHLPSPAAPDFEGQAMMTTTNRSLLVAACLAVGLTAITTTTPFTSPVFGQDKAGQDKKKKKQMKVPKPKVIKMASPNKDSRPGGAKIDTIVLHHTAGGGTAKDVGKQFQNPKAEVSSHYIVDKQGAIVQPVEDKDRSWHAGESVFKGRKDVNDFSIGIEMVNKGDGKDPFTDKQYASMGKLVAYLQGQYGIPRDRVTGHKDVALPKGRKNDPAPNFSYKRLFEEVEKARGGKPDAKADGKPDAKPKPKPKPKPKEK